MALRLLVTTRRTEAALGRERTTGNTEAGRRKTPDVEEALGPTNSRTGLFDADAPPEAEPGSVPLSPPLPDPRSVLEARLPEPGRRAASQMVGGD